MSWFKDTVNGCVAKMRPILYIWGYSLRGTGIMDTSTPFKWRHFEAEIILLCVRYTFGIRFLQHNPRDLVLSSDASNLGAVELQEVA